MDQALINQLVAALVAVIMALLAWYENRSKADAKEETVAAKAETKEVIAYFDPADKAVTKPPAAVPATTYIMNETTKKWILASETEADKPSILAQIAAAEATGVPTYTIITSRGTYIIEYGLLLGGQKNEQ